jgi:ribosomal protein S12 methylthiotransferase accessory factor
VIARAEPIGTASAASRPLLRGLAAIPDRAKRYLAGTHRVVTPEETLERVTPFAARIGLTRLGMVTGLDRIGMPVAAAYRPNSRSIAVFQGKGLSVAAAKASAFMEALESFHAETIDLPLRWAARRELAASARVVDAARLPLCRASPYDERQPLLWIEACELFSGAPIWVPHELVTARFTLPQPPGSHCFAASTNGLASGNDRLEAIAHGLYEVIERDAIALWLLGGTAARAASAIDPASIDAAAIVDLLARCRHASVHAGLWDATSDLDVPVVAAALQDESERIVDFGFGCHAAREVALLRALTEAAQARLTRISGARDDYGDELYPDDPTPADRRASTPFVAAPRRRYDELPDIAGTTLRADLEAVAARLSARGLDEIAVVDLSRTEFGIDCVRVLVPGLEGPAHSRDVDVEPGERARRARGR